MGFGELPVVVDWHSCKMWITVSGEPRQKLHRGILECLRIGVCR